MANRPTAQTFNNDVALLWLLKNGKTVYRSVLAQAEADKSNEGLSTTQTALANWAAIKADIEERVQEINETFDALEQTLRAQYSLKSDLETLENTFTGQYLTTAAFEAQFNTIQTSINASIGNYDSTLKGQIVRGYMDNPDYGIVPDADPYLYGIMIASQTSITTTTKDDLDPEGNVYYEIDMDSDPTFGFYTSEGWQFWIGGTRAGYYNSKDGRLHTAKQEVEGDILMGDWLMTDSSGFGIKYLGA